MKQSNPDRKRIKDETGKSRLRQPFENHLDAHALLQYDLSDQAKPGAWLLQTGSRGSESLKFKFAWECEGIHTLIDPETEETLFNAIEAFFKEIPNGESLTFHLLCFADDSDRQKELDRLVATSPTPELRFLALADKQRTHDLTWRTDRKGRVSSRGSRKSLRLLIYGTYTINSEMAKGADIWEKILLKGQSLFHKFTGFDAHARRQNYEIAFDAAFNSGFLRLDQLLKTKAKLNIRALTAQELWEVEWKTFNRSEPIPVPQVVCVTREGIEEEIKSDIHFTSLLLQKAAPVDDRAWVHVNDRYVAPMVFLDKPGGWYGKFAQLSYLSKVINRSEVVDTEIICEFTTAEQWVIKDNMRRITKQSYLDKTIALTRGNTIDVRANLQQEKAVCAQEQLIEGGIAIQTGVVILVHRNTLSELNNACNYIENCFQRPAWVQRETEYAWEIWLQSLHLSWSLLLQKPWERRMVFLSSEAPGMMPIVLPTPIDSTGLELITEEGACPLFIDWYNAAEINNTGIIAMTRAGKSLLVGQLLTLGLQQNIPTIIVDFPPSESASTFRDWCRYLGGSYFDLMKEANNFFELPDLTGLSPQEIEDRMDYTAGIVDTFLMILVFGTKASGSADTNLKRTIQSILTPTVRSFFEDEGIQHRFALARQHGLGSREWENTPTLRDFFWFFKQNALGHFSEETRNDPMTRTAFSQIERQLKYWIDQRGDAIARPSTFDSNNPLLVFGLIGMSDQNEEAAIFSFSAYVAAIRRSLSHRRSNFFLDEASILLKWDDIGELVSRLCVNGGKAGIQSFIAAQEINTLINSESGATIIKNLKTKLLGRIDTTAINDVSHFFGYPREVVAVNASKKFYPQKAEMYSQWLLDSGGLLTYVRFRPNRILLALLANNPVETACRQSFMSKYPNKYEALVYFANELVDSLKNARPLRQADGGEIQIVEDKKDETKHEMDNVIYLQQSS